jgi:hypothetical protein
VVFSKLSKIFGAHSHQESCEFDDPVLGTLRFSADGKWWEAVVNTEIGPISFHIGGVDKPASESLTHAREIVSSCVAFQKMTREFLQREVTDNKAWARYRDEILSLGLEDISLLRPDHPDDGMIYFSGGEEGRIWRCSYIARRPKSLAFDS